MNKKRKLTPQQLTLKKEFDAMMAKHSKPLERGARAKGAKSSSPPMSKLAAPHVERTRVSTAKSLDTGARSTAVKETQTYTGDKMLGVSQMHKSNLVPVFNAEAVEDITKMRRG